MIVVLCKLKNPHGYQPYGVSLLVNNPVTHYVGARVDA